MPDALHTELDREAIRSLFVRAMDVRYWRSLIPDMTVGGQPAAEAVADTPSEEAFPLAILKQVQEDGWFQLDPVFPAEALVRLKNALDLLMGAGWLPVFSFMYDEFWTLTRAAPVRLILSSLLGPEYRQRPYFWTHYVQVRTGAHGWRPHADASGSPGLLPSGRPAMMSLWIPLSEATLDNGCMYVIPTSCRPTIGARFDSLGGVTRDELETLLQSARALPAEAGSVMGWHGQVVHWGSTANGRSTHPRISLALEFQNAELAEDSSTLLMDPDAPLPSFRQRLLLIAAQIKMYLTRFEQSERTINMLALATLLHSWFEQGRGGPA